MSLVTVGIILVVWAWIVAAAAAFQVVVDWMAVRENAARTRVEWLTTFVRRVR